MLRSCQVCLAALLLWTAPWPGWSGSRPEATTVPVVVTTIFPNYDFTRAVAGDRLDVRLLLPPGVEAHTYEPTPGDVVLVARAAAFVYTGEAMEPWVPDFLRGVGNTGLVVVDASRDITLVPEPGHAEEMDPHIWLDPVLAARMVETIAATLAQLDPGGAPTFRTNAAAYGARLSELHGRIETELAPARGKTIVYGGHFAFGYFARRYGLEYVSPYRGFSPDAEPTPQAVAEMVEALRTTGARVVFYEELLEPRVARAIAEATGARLELLHGVHNVSREEIDGGVSYLTLMEDNLRKLKVALLGT